MTRLRIALGGTAVVEPGQVLRLSETDRLELTDLPVGGVVRIGPDELQADAAGTVEWRSADSDTLGCCLGRVPVRTPDGLEFELDVQPGKITGEAYAALRADLENTWIGLTLDPAAPSSVEARRGVPPDLIWRALEPVVRDIVRDPRRTVRAEFGPLEHRRLKSFAGLPPSMAVHLDDEHRPLWGIRPVHRIDRADLGVVVDTLQHLAARARRWPDAAVERAVLGLLARPPLRGVARSSGVTHGARHDPRYRAVLRIRAQLDDPGAIVTEGPGELRLGVRALDRLYEYWVFLKVLVQAIERFGPPDPLELERLARNEREGVLRLELAPGTTVSFANGTRVAFEPSIRHLPPESWGGLELPVHPVDRHRHGLATPDVLVLGPDPSRALVIDAKYRGRHHIEEAAFEVHAKYARLRFQGRGVVEHVLVIHPHQGYSAAYAGYGHLGWTPGSELAPLPWERIDGPAKGAAASAEPVQPETVAELTGLLGPASLPLLIADQRWMRQAIGNARIDLRRLHAAVAADARPLLVLPSHDGLTGFAHAAERAGWTLIETAVDRASQLLTLRQLLRIANDRQVTIVSGDARFRAVATAELAGGFQAVDDLEALGVWLH